MTIVNFGSRAGFDQSHFVSDCFRLACVSNNKTKKGLIVANAISCDNNDGGLPTTV